MLSLEAGTSVLSAVTMADDGAVVVRLYETSGKDDAVTLHFGADVKSAASVNLLEQENGPGSEGKRRRRVFYRSRPLPLRGEGTAVNAPAAGTIPAAGAIALIAQQEGRGVPRPFCFG